MSIRSYRVPNLLIWTRVASYGEFCLFEKLYVESFAFFGLIHAVSTRGKFELEMACCTLLEGFQVVSSYF
jgi:hypothetical protein